MKKENQEKKMSRKKERRIENKKFNLRPE